MGSTLKTLEKNLGLRFLGEGPKEHDRHAVPQTPACFSVL